MLVVNNRSEGDTNAVQTHGKRRYRRLTLLPLVCVILLGWGLFLSSCVVADYSSVIIVENNTPTQVTIFYNSDQIEEGGYKYTSFIDLGVVPAGETKELYGPFVGGFAAVPRVYLRARDYSGKIIWEDSWTGKEFGDLIDPSTYAFRIVLNP